jgi:hypothetical protein
MRSPPRAHWPARPRKAEGAWVFELERYRLLLERVIEQTKRRVLKPDGERGGEGGLHPRAHSDIIVKNGRETLYGHKIYLTGGASGLVLDCPITEGNPADSTLLAIHFAVDRRVIDQSHRFGIVGSS